MINYMGKEKCIQKEEMKMAVNVTSKKPLFGNKRSHALNATRKKQGVNLQTVTLEDGTKVRLSAREIRTMRKNEKIADAE